MRLILVNLLITIILSQILLVTVRTDMLVVCLGHFVILC